MNPYIPSCTLRYHHTTSFIPINPHIAHIHPHTHIHVHPCTHRHPYPYLISYPRPHPRPSIRPTLSIYLYVYIYIYMFLFIYLLFICVYIYIYIYIYISYPLSLRPPSPPSEGVRPQWARISRASERSVPLVLTSITLAVSSSSVGQNRPVATV